MASGALPSPNVLKFPGTRETIAAGEAFLTGRTDSFNPFPLPALTQGERDTEAYLRWRATRLKDLAGPVPTHVKQGHADAYRLFEYSHIRDLDLTLIGAK